MKNILEAVKQNIKVEFQPDNRVILILDLSVLLYFTVTSGIIGVLQYILWRLIGILIAEFYM